MSIIIENVQISLDLTSEERDILQDCEAKIERGLNVFVEVGQSLQEINIRRLYRAEHATFEEYIEKRWPQISSVRRAYQIMEAAEVVQNVKNFSHSESGILPANEAQARALADVPAEAQAEVLQKAVESAPEGKLTATHIKQTADTHLGKEKEDKPLERPETTSLLKPSAPVAEPEKPAEKISEEKAVVTDTRASAQPPATPRPAGTPPTATTTFVQHVIPQEEDDWLWENDLTAATAIAELREARTQLYNANMALRRPQLTPLAEQALMALLERRNQNPDLEPTTPRVLLETILVVRCQDAGINIITESEERDDEQ